MPSVMKDLYPNGMVVRLRSKNNKYLFAGEDKISVTLVESDSSENVRWTVEFSYESDDIFRLKSCYGSKDWVKLITRDGSFLRANGGLPPWKDTVTHDVPWAFQDLVLWDVQPVEIGDICVIL
ncbi:uncharacterized protein LOC131310381 isoform X2 [Rhododendron vialii]|uniref:uncharacterized protein LOC131310381 isoform X2 n=1 Tax=Rhododendron vialii TaxID=182163 RepID=UPI00266020DC|nr:uncharacterized protein LOC131310381 isoform X2 [Rhododendron vialii]